MRTLHAFVLATRRAPLAAPLYRAAYGAAARGCARGLSDLKGVTAAVLHRGAARAPEPGVSDLDFLLLRRPLAPAEESAWLSRLAARRGALRRAFPMLGDLWAAEPAELDFYLRRGGLRAWEDRPGWRALAGTLPPAPSYAGGALRRRLDAWVWAFTAHMELTRRLLRPGPDLPAKRDADMRKMHGDCRRLCDFILEGGTAPAPRPAPDPREGRLLWLDSAARLDEASRALCWGAAAGTANAAPWPAPAEPRAAAALRAATRARAVVVDAPYHSWAVLEDGAPPQRLWEAARLLAAEPSLPGVPMALTASSWSLLLQSSYLGAPLGGADGAPGDEAPGLFAGWGPRSAGEPRAGLRLLPAALRREAAAEAAAWMGLWWRGLWSEERYPNRFVLYHLHVRAAELGRRLAGEAPPSSWASLLDGPALRFAREEPAACVDALPRAALAPEHAAALASAMARLREAA